MTTPLERAERDLNSLEEQREALFSRAKLLSKERDQIAFAALTAGDKKAKARLNEINAEDSGLAANIASVEAALTVGRSNVANAKQAEAIASDRAKAEQIRALKVAFIENGVNVGDALSDFVGSLMEMMKQRDEMQALGLTAPTSRQFHVSALIAIKTALMTLPQPMVRELQEWQLLLHPARRSFKDITTSWDAMITRQIAERLGDDNERAA